MKHITISAVVVLMLALPVAAVDVVLKDGTVIKAQSFTMTGSYVMLTLENGARLAYAVEDVNLDSLQMPATDEEKEVKKEEQAELAEEKKEGLSSSAFSGAVANTEGGEAAMTVSDKDVGHVRPQAPGAEEEGEEGEEAETAVADEGGGGSVSLRGVRVVPMGDGRFQVQGRVANTSSVRVMDVRAVLTITIGDSQTTSEISIAGSLANGQEAEFTHSFSADASSTPRVAAKLLWMAPASPVSPPAES
jgi:hypothetical protein